MLALLGFATIALFLVLILTKRLSVITALVLVPLVLGLLAGFNPQQLGEMMLSGIKQVAPTGIMLVFAVLYFAVMLDAGLFDPIVAVIIRVVKGDPLKVVMGTASFQIFRRFCLFVCHDALMGGVTTSLAMDTHGKTLSYALLEMEV